MILQFLDSYYQRLESSGDDSLVMPGYSRQNITFCIVLKANGELVDITDERDATGKKPVPKRMQVLGVSKPSGSGINPCTLWDNMAYLLGFKVDDNKPERTRQTFDASRDYHLALKSEINDPEFEAVCQFMSAWDPERAKEFPVLKELSTGFGLFRIVNESHYVHESKRVSDWWSSKLVEQAELHDGKSADADREMQCLISGKRAAIARIHEPKIQGVNGAQSAGALLVSFNFDAAESYGRKQSFVAPVSQEASFRYAVALNKLLDRGGGRRLQIGDATTVFWTAESAPIENSFTGLLDPGSVENEELKARLLNTLSKISKGEFPTELGEPQSDFYVLGLSPNAARISIRFWWRGTIEQIVRNIGLHFQDLAIAKPPNAPEYPALWQILGETARESKDIPPNLSGAIMRSILEGIDYPSVLFQCLMRRIKADSDIPTIRAAAIKASLNRSFRLNPSSSVLSRSLEMSLNKDRPEIAYQLGRLFAILEKTQEDSSGGSLNATIKDRFFSAASATPAMVFPRLIRLNQHHVGKLSSKAFQVSAEKRTQEVFDRIDSFPSHLNMKEQGLFAIGYYHQRQDFFTKKEKNPVATDAVS